MKRTARITILMAAMALAWNVWAGDDTKDKEKKKPKIVPVKVYLGNSDVDSGLVRKALFDSLLKQGLTSKDSNGRVFNVTSYMFTFCERVLYEDSVGNPFITTDYLSEYNFESKLKDYQLNALLTRAKPGDTVIFEQIKLQATDSTKAIAYGKALKVVVTK